MKTTIFTLRLLAFLFTFPSFAFAAIFVVNDNGDTQDANTFDNLCADSSGNCTLRAAIQQANGTEGDDTITFALPIPSTIILSGICAELQITTNINIIGLGARNLEVTTQTLCQPLGTFNISNNAFVVSISGITVSNAVCGIGNLGLGQLNLYDVAIRNNRKGICFNQSIINITNSVISGSSRGGISHTGSVLNISNSTISNNNSDSDGSGIYNTGSGLTLNNVTVSHNSTSGIGGGIYSTSSAPSVRNTIIANNTAVSNPDIFGVFNSLGNNLISKSGNGATGFTNGVNDDIVGTLVNPINPFLGALQNNGGQTDTRSLLAGSPAIDAGNNCVVTATCPSNNPSEPLLTDQRGTGFPRRIDGDGNGTAIVDIGAFEVQQAVTAANISVSGRVTTASGRGIRNVQITLTDSQGVERTVTSTTFGYYHFNDVMTGETITLTAKTRRFRFNQSSIVRSTNESITDADFVSQ